MMKGAPLLSGFLSGLLFALGLGMGGMTRPEKIIGFLDVAGNWNPSLALVMAGALVVAMPAFAWILRRNAPLFGDRFAVPQNRRADMRLLGGAALFGTGWGLAGLCPGPAIANLVTLNGSILLFVAAMLAGLYLGKRIGG